MLANVKLAISFLTNQNVGRYQRWESGHEEFQSYLHLSHPLHTT